MKYLYNIVIFILISSCVISCKKTNSQLTILKDPTIINIFNGQLSAKSLLIENGFIKEIGDYDQLAKKRPKNIIDCKGKYVIPGLFDMHMHIAEEENMIPQLDKLLKHGIIGIRDMGGLQIRLPKQKK